MRNNEMQTEKNGVNQRFRNTWPLKIFNFTLTPIILGTIKIIDAIPILRRMKEKLMRRGTSRKSMVSDPILLRATRAH